MPKKFAGFRLEEKLIKALENISIKYPRLSLTDIADMALKFFVYSLIQETHSKEWLDQLIGKYMRGELDVSSENLKSTSKFKPLKKN